jgi:hypothetical protein
MFLVEDPEDKPHHSADDNGGAEKLSGVIAKYASEKHAAEEGTQELMKRGGWNNFQPSFQPLLLDMYRLPYPVKPSSQQEFAAVSNVSQLVDNMAAWKDSNVETVMSHLMETPSLLLHTNGMLGGPISEATSGKPYHMNKTRVYNGTQPDWTVTVQTSTNNHTLSCSSKQWAVVTTIFNVTPVVEALDAMQDWCLVVVADKKSKASAKEYFPALKRLIYLRPDDQELLEFRTIKHTPWNHFSRKNIGFLYAMRAGAEVILDVDDDNDLVEKTIPMTSIHGSNNVRLVRSPGPINVYQFFEPSMFIWPRGFPLHAIQQSKPEVANETVDADSVVVLQHLANFNPDVDAIWRLTTPGSTLFKQGLDPVVLGSGAWAPFNAQATTWRKGSFRAMRLPNTVHGRVSDIWRSYMAQPLFWSENQSIAFVEPRFAVPSRNEHNLEGDFDKELPLYRQGRALMEHLTNASSKALVLGSRPLEQLFNMYVDLYEHEILQVDDVVGIKAWIEDLLEIGVHL